MPLPLGLPPQPPSDAALRRAFDALFTTGMTFEEVKENPTLWKALRNAAPRYEPKKRSDPGSPITTHGVKP